MTLSKGLPAALFETPTDVPVLQSLRLASANDVRLLHGLFYSNLAWSRFRESAERSLDRQQRCRVFWLIGESDTGIIACGQLLLYPHSAELANINVAADEQGKGVGTAIVNTLVGIARYLGLVAVEIGVDASNRRALALYERLGFVEDRRLALPTGESAIILRKTL